MSDWTPAAREELERYFEQVRGRIKASGADPVEVIDDLRRHVHEEVAAAGLVVVTEEDVRRITARVGVPEASAQGGQPGAALPPLQQSSPPDPLPDVGGPSLWLVVFGVGLPIVSLAFELFSGICGGAFFDPIPTFWHVGLILLVPLANWLAWWALREERVQLRARLGWANGIALGVSLFYAIVFLPLSLPGLIGVIWFGFGLLPLSPLCAFISAIALRRGLRRLGMESERVSLPGLWRGMALALLALALVESPVWVTRWGMRMALAEDAQTRSRGLGWLRRLGHQETMLRDCYGRTPMARGMDPLTWVFGADPVSSDQARTLFYQVEGRTFDSFRAPNVRMGRGSWVELRDWTWDADQGGTVVGGRLHGLGLETSRLDAVMDPDAGLAYTEWTLEFRNSAQRQREARAQILLPPGAVVSRLTLWVNGEEREAAFAGRAQVREAYQQVAIRQRRDPVLVTTCGPDRVLIQCFPVPANNGKMKVRVGITAPLALESAGLGVLRWPCFLERNFTLSESLRHSVWADSPRSLTTEEGLLKSEEAKPGLHSLRGQMSDSELAAPRNALRAQRDSQVSMAWTQETRGTTNGHIRQTIEEASPSALKHVVCVVDGSRAMSPHLADIATALAGFAPETDLRLLTASDSAEISASPASPRGANSRDDAIRQLRQINPVGGQDNVPALVRAWDLAAERPGSAILWIHGPQPIEMQSVEALRQDWERRPGGPVLYEIQTGTGPNRVLEKLDGVRAVRSVPRFGSLSQDILRLIEVLEGRKHSLEYRRELFTGGSVPADDKGHPTSMHLARLWAADEVNRLRKVKQIEPAMELAALYQLVTPVTGAVVLETAAQYRATGLQPVDATTVPSIPEPETWILLVAGLVVVVMARRKRARREGVALR